MRAITVTQTGAGSTDAIPCDLYISPFNLGLGCVVDGTVNFTIQHTFDDIFDADVTPTWFDHPVLQSLTGNTDGNYAFPVRAIRATVHSGAGSVTLTLIQAGRP